MSATARRIDPTAWLVPAGLLLDLVGFCVLALGLFSLIAGSPPPWLPGGRGQFLASWAMGMLALLGLGLFFMPTWLAGFLLATLAWSRIGRGEALAYGVAGGLLSVASSISLLPLALRTPTPTLACAIMAPIIGGFLVMAGAVAALEKPWARP